jgi:tRNA A37 threonylcarbamoyladenosine biosynthesis protein TsaE
MNIFDHFQHINLTNDQRKALEMLHSFLVSDERVFILQGYAGSGKTTLLKGLTEYLSSEQASSKLMAPTGRAAMVITNKTKKPASTIHRLIYNMSELKEKLEGTSFKYFFGLNQNEDNTNCVYFIDEASMISDAYSDDEFFRFGSGHLLKDLMQYIFVGENNRKIVFIGDSAQLPPVDMNFSPALDRAYLEQNYNGKIQDFGLSEVVRQQQESGILNSATKIRKAIALNEFNEFDISSNNKDVHKTLPGDFLTQYVKAAKQGEVSKTIVITHSNRQAVDYNMQIRSLRYGDKANQIQKEDVLIITRNNYNGIIELYNGMFARVVEVGDIVYRASPRFYIDGKKTVERKLVFREVLVDVMGVDGKSHHVKTTLLDNFLMAESGKLHPYDQRALYIDFKNRMNDKGVKSATVEFKDALRSDLYFNAIQAKYGYAITCHKSQGGEWDNVFVDFQVFIGKMSKAFYRWSYTAITRSSETLYCIDAPQYNAFNQFVIRDIETLSKVNPQAYVIPKSASDPMYFVKYRLDRIEALAKNQEIRLQVKTPNNQLELTFMLQKDSARLQLWYSKKGFTKTTWISSSSDNMKLLVEQLLVESLLSDQIEFSPKFDFQIGLHNYILDLIKEENIVLTNIVQQEWSDIYFLRTDADFASIEFWYDINHVYTFAKPRSIMGQFDASLLRLMDRLRGLPV